MTADDGDLNLEDVAVESGFRMRQEVGATFKLEADVVYLFIPMTYRRSIFSSVLLRCLKPPPSLGLAAAVAPYLLPPHMSVSALFTTTAIHVIQPARDPPLIPFHPCPASLLQVLR